MAAINQLNVTLIEQWETVRKIPAQFTLHIAMVDIDCAAAMCQLYNINSVTVDCEETLCLEANGYIILYHTYLRGQQL